MPNRQKYLLLIDTSTQNCSVAICNHEKVLFQKFQSEHFNHAAILPAFVQTCLDETNLTLKNISAIVVSIGPGSYSGLRVGLSYAKALCMALKIPLLCISTLEMMTDEMLQLTAKAKGIYIPLIDARRMEVFTAAYNNDFEIVEEPHALIINEKSWEEILNEHQVYFGGPAVAKTKNVIQHTNATFIEKELCAAKNLFNKAWQKFNRKEYSDVAYAEPFYLKEFNERI